MKTILTLLLVCSLAELRAQVITYDYQSRKHTPETPFVPHGGMLTYRIVNINSFAQKVVINGTAISMTTEMPAQLATLFSIKVEADKELENTGDQVEEMVKAGEGADPALKTAIKRLVTDCQDYYRKAEKIKDALALEERLAETMRDKNFCNVAKMTQALSSGKIDAASIGNLQADLHNFEAAYGNVYTDYQKTAAIADSVGDKDKAARIRTALGQIEKDYEELEVQYKKTLFSIDDLFVKATNPDNYEVMSLPLKLAGVAGTADEVTFRIKIDEKDFLDTFDVDGGLKVDFSVGPVLNFTSDDHYFFDTENALRQRTKASRFETITPAVSSMIHVYRRRYRGIAVGGTFGVNAEIKELTDINLGFLAGVSTILGKSQKVILSTGVNYLKVNRLKEGQYKVGTVYSDTKIDDVTERVLRPSWFVAVSLNLARRKVLTP